MSIIAQLLDSSAVPSASASSGRRSGSAARRFSSGLDVPVPYEARSASARYAGLSMGAQRASRAKLTASLTRAY